MIARAKQTRRNSRETRGAVLAVCREILASGGYPAHGLIMARTGLARTVVQRWRDRLLAEGAIEFEHAGTGPKRARRPPAAAEAPPEPEADGWDDDLEEPSPEELAAIQERYHAVRAAKLAQAPPASFVAPLREHSARIVAYAGPEDAWEGGGL